MTTFSPACLRSFRSGTVSFLRSSAIAILAVVAPGACASGAEFLLVGALVERGDLAVDRLVVRGERRLVEVVLRPRLGIEVLVLVGAAHEHRRIAHLRLAHV